jgi:uncharacterized membrane protein YfcA
MAIWPLVLIGFCVGVIGGYFGIGGAFMVTPALNIFGFPMAYAVGTDMAHVAGKSVVATFRHWRFGHVSVLLAVLMIIGTFPGIEVGAQLIMWLTKKGIEGPVVRWVYIAILGFLAIYVLTEYFKARKQEKITGKSVGDVVGTKLSDYVQKTLTVPPVIHCPMANIRISAWAVIFVGCLTGLVAGFLGVGGGFLRVPALLYIIGVPTKVAVGTDLFEVMISGAYGGFSYAVKGKVELVAAVIMLFGAAVGAQFGTLTTKYVQGLFIRFLFGVTVAAAAVSVTLRQIGWFFERTYSKTVQTFLGDAGYTAEQIRTMMVKRDVMHHYLVETMSRPDFFDNFMKFWVLREISQYLMLGSAIGLSAYILYLCFKGMANERRQLKSQAKTQDKTAKG